MPSNCHSFFVIEFHKFRYDEYGVIKELVHEIEGNELAENINKYYIHKVGDIEIIESLTPVDSFLSNLGNCNYLYHLVEVKDGLIISDYKAIMVRV